MEAQLYSQNSQKSSANQQGNKTTTKHILFIGGIPLQASKIDLIRYISKFAIADHVSLPIDYKTGLHKGFAKAFFKSEAAMNNILKPRHHMMLGVDIGVSKWVPKSKHQPKTEVPSHNKVFFKFRSQFSQNELKDFFNTFGRVDHIQIKSDYLTGKIRDFGFVMFESESSAIKLIENGPSYQVKSGKLYVQESRSKKQLAKETKMKQNQCPQDMRVNSSAIQISSHSNDVNANFTTAADIHAMVLKKTKHSALLASENHETACVSPKSHQLEGQIIQTEQIIRKDEAIVSHPILNKQSPMLVQILSICYEGWIQLNHQAFENLKFNLPKNTRQLVPARQPRSIINAGFLLF